MLHWRHCHIGNILRRGRVECEETPGCSMQPVGRRWEGHRSHRDGWGTSSGPTPVLYGQPLLLQGVSTSKQNEELRSTFWGIFQVLLSFCCSSNGCLLVNGCAVRSLCQILSLERLSKNIIKWFSKISITPLAYRIQSHVCWSVCAWLCTQWQKHLLMIKWSQTRNVSEAEGTRRAGRGEPTAHKPTQAQPNNTKPATASALRRPWVWKPAHSKTTGYGLCSLEVIFLGSLLAAKPVMEVKWTCWPLRFRCSSCFQRKHWH